MMKKPLVKNAANEKQIKNAEINEKNIRITELNDLRVILNLPQGRRFLWRLMSHCKLFSSIWRPSAEIHKLAGQQEIGQFILSEIVQADENLLFEMMKENKKERENA